VCHNGLVREIFADTDLNAQARDGSTALHIVARVAGKYREHDSDFWMCLIDMGANPLLEDGEGRSSLDVAVLHGNKHLLELVETGK
jgi:ankyrin repeat protein